MVSNYVIYFNIKILVERDITGFAFILPMMALLLQTIIKYFARLEILLILFDRSIGLSGLKH